MNTDDEFPATLMEAICHFAKPGVAFDFMVNLRWPDGVQCPRCGCKEVKLIRTRQIWECPSCVSKRQFSVRVGTIFEDSPLSLHKWLAVIWMLANAKNGISSYEVHRAIGVTQKTGWFMLARVRLAMQAGTFEKMTGEVEADETFIGGRAQNMHLERKQRRGRGTGGVGKAIVMGLLERTSTGKPSKVKTKVIPNTKRHTVQAEVRTFVEPGSEVFTDALASYAGLNDKYLHDSIDHAVCYVRGKVHTNGLENFWSLLKRSIKGTYVSVEPCHLFRYLDEQAFRFNERKDDDAGRFKKVAASVVGKRLTYRKLIGEFDKPD